MKFNMVLKQFKLNILILLLNEFEYSERNNFYCVKKINIGMHPDA